MAGSHPGSPRIGSGAIRQYAGSEGIARLLADPDVSQALSGAVTEAAPPTYQLDMEPWLAQMLARKPRMLVAVALANKTARIIWALLARGGVYRAPALAA